MSQLIDEPKDELAESFSLPPMRLGTKEEAEAALTVELERYRRAYCFGLSVGEAVNAGDCGAQELYTALATSFFARARFQSARVRFQLLGGDLEAFDALYMAGDDLPIN